MRFRPLDIPGVVHIEAEPHVDERGFFARIYCPHEFAAAGIDFTPQQHNLSRNTERFTLRGMHFQALSHPESKLVRATRGRIYDVALDLRPESPTFRRWAAVELSAERADALFIPPGVAHGFLTLEAETDVLYIMGAMHVAGAGQGVRWNDPAFAIDWPAAPAVISARDAAYPDFVP